ncbi:MAG: FAD:protein FMN transferase [Planctomycetota bacterium]|nr:FAD:protein FMN transferase [Planctomycetota bacterium]
MRRTLRAIAAMGTRFELVLEAPDAASGRWTNSALNTLAEACVEEILQWHRALSRFEKDSLLSFLNREAHQRPVRVDPRLARALLIAREVFDRTAGAFDPVASGGTMADVDVVCDAVAFRARGGAPAPLALDLGSIAKGLALDAVQEILTDASPTAARELSAFIHGGTSSVFVLGTPSIEPGHPRVRTRRGEHAVPLPMDGGASHLSVSSARPAAAHGTADTSHLRVWGRPLPSHERTAAVRLSGNLADSGAWAEAWSTALCVTGDAAPFETWAAARGVGAWALIDDAQGVHGLNLDCSSRHALECA